MPPTARRSNPVPLQPDWSASNRNTVAAITRAALASAHHVLDRSVSASEFARASWRDDRTVEVILRAASSPAATTQVGWAQELSHVTAAFLASLVPQSAAADLLSRGLQLRFAGNKSITLPTISQSASAAFVAELQPIPVNQFTTAPGVMLAPYKLEMINVATRELLESSNAEAILRTTLAESAGLGLDQALFSSNAGTAGTAPPGLLFNITPLVASTTTPLYDALLTDLGQLGGAIARIAGNNVLFVAAPEQAIAIGLQAENFSYPVLASKALPPKTVIAIAPAALVSAYDAVPEITASREPSLVMDTAPGAIGGGSQQTYTMFQTDSIAIKMRLPVAYALRAANAIAWMQNVTW
jgi:hypothetical protein